jgi:Tfp pilus assembly protein PilV
MGRSRWHHSGFTLIEVAVAGVIGVILVLAVGKLGLNATHQRVSSDSISAAVSLAEQRLEKLKALPSPATASDLTVAGNTHADPSNPIKEDGTAGGKYNVTWTVTDSGAGAFYPAPGVKKIVINVQHANNPMVNVTLATYYKVS